MCAKASCRGHVDTWGYEEGPPQRLVTSHVPDFPRHVDKAPGDRGHAAEVENSEDVKVEKVLSGWDHTALSLT